jgi:AraC-like DNA-binding protein
MQHNVHHLIGTDQEIHLRYGLRIVKMVRNCVTTEKFSEDKIRYFEFYCISHLFDGAGELWLPEHGMTPVQPGECVIVSPNQLHWYGSQKNSMYIEDSVCFTGPVADMLFRSGVLSIGKFKLGTVRKLLSIIELALNPTNEGQIAANIELEKLIFSIYEIHKSFTSDNKLDGVLKLMRENIDRWYQVSELAQLCDLSDDQFRRLFVAQNGMNPKEYMEQLKMNLASERILADDTPINEIAQSLGYTDQFHFSKRFKKHHGLSPTEYRAAYHI